jgi:NADPH:quinone reductase-like Zn-dependent oxidoreductase
LKALTLTAPGSLDALQVQDLPPPPSPGPDQVLLRVRAVALNRLDLFVVDGLPGITLKFPHVVCSDAAGVVEAVGSGVSGFESGQPVLVNPGISCYACEYCLRGDHSLCRSYGVLGEHVPGSAAELLLVPARNLAPVPSGMPWDQAAAFSLATMTAWRMLVHRAALRAGETVVIWGIGGGVSLAALQVAKLAGARAIVTSSSDAKLAAAAELGADIGLNHTTANVPQEVRRITGGRGAEVVVDNVGEKTWADSLRCLGRAGRLVTCGATTGPMCVTDVRKLFWYQWSILGSTMGGHEDYREVVRLAAMGKLWPKVDRVFPLAEGRAAFERLRQGAQLGKIVIEVSRE